MKNLKPFISLINWERFGSRRIAVGGEDRCRGGSWCGDAVIMGAAIMVVNDTAMLLRLSSFHWASASALSNVGGFTNATTSCKEGIRLYMKLRNTKLLIPSSHYCQIHRRSSYSTALSLDTLFSMLAWSFRTRLLYMCTFSWGCCPYATYIFQKALVYLFKLEFKHKCLLKSFPTCLYYRGLSPYHL